MNSADYVDQLIVDLKAQGVPLQEVAWQTAKACVGWPYVFGARGGKTTKDGIVVRKFDCRGFTYWVLLAVYGWKLMGSGCTTQWNDESNWKAKGLVSDGIPKDTLVCLFYPDKTNPKKMAHTGFGYNGETCECSKGVQYFKSMNKKWTHWGVPACIGGDVPPPDPSYRPTLRRGDKGEYVTLMQTKLAMRGYDLGSSGIDGNFGKATEKAVKQFQQDWGLVQDGICGKKTWEMLESSIPSALCTVHIPHLTRAKAEDLQKQYIGAWITEDENA